MVGRTLGHYKIIEPLGAGGMGEVYRAHDTVLERDVAIKVLPEDFATDAERLARFEREAKLLASLNHSNIAGIHGLEDADGVRFIAMEVVEGETLAEQITRSGRIEVDEALEIACQIAEALEAAHENGVIHRDLKPANIKVTPDGKVKVLDFGLAKAYEADGSPSEISPDLSKSPTAAAATGTGVILGTAAYMSPEQARGKPLDKRTDIWAFGCVLFEMLSGRRAFDGETLTDTMAAILKAEPDWEGVPRSVPWRVQELLQRCLQKDPRQRLRDIGDARIAIDQALSDTAEDFVGSPQGTGGGPASVSAIRSSRVAVGASLAVAAVCVGIAAWSSFSRPASVLSEPTRLTINLGQGQSLAVTPQSSLAVSPDGTRLVYAATFEGREMLHLRRIDEFGSSPLLGTEGALSPFFSADGEWIGFFADSQLKRIAASGGEAETIGHVAAAPAGATWLPDGTIVFATAYTATGLFRIPAGGGPPEVLTTPNRRAGEYAHVWPRYLPGGQDVLFTNTGEDGEFDIALLSLRTREWRVLMRGGAMAAYVPSGHMVYGQRDQLVAVPYDLVRRELTGSPVTVIEDAWKPHAAGAAHFAVSRDGDLYYAPSEGLYGGTLGWIDREGRATALPFEREMFGDVRLSPDGTLAILARSEATQAWGDLWIYDLERGGRTRMTPSVFRANPAWQPPNGEWIAFSLRQEGSPGLYRQRVDMSGDMELLFRSRYPVWPISFSPDGRLLAYYEVNPETGRDIWVLPLEGDRTPIPFLVTEASERSPVFSPNGRWIAYASNESGRDEVYVRPYPPGSGGQVLVSTAGGREPVWARDGSELFYRSGNRMMAVPVEVGPDFRRGEPVVLFERRFAVGVGGMNQQYDVSPDGRRFLMMILEDEQLEVTRINVVLNWLEELKRLVPVRQ